MTPQEIARRFTYYTPRSQQRKDQHQEVRDHCHDLARLLDNALPDGREKSLAITKIEEAMFWANAAIARPLEGRKEA